MVPVKNVAQAKQRLSAVLDAGERTALAEAMLRDVLLALARLPQCPPVAIVTSDPSAGQMARRFSFEIIEDPINQGETESIEMATRVCEAGGASGTLVLPGDIPLVRENDLREILTAAPPRGTLLVPSADGRGTNAALRRPAGLFPLIFGGDSFQRHRRAARDAGEACVTLHLPGIALDIDTPADLALLLAAEGNSNAQRLLREWNVAERFSAPTSA